MWYNLSMNIPTAAHTSAGHVITVLKEHLSKDNNVLFALLFGSYASGRQKKRSDIDVAVYFKSPPSGLDLFCFINSLSDICGSDIDLVVLNTASPFLKHQIMKYGILLEIKDRLSYRQFRERLISEYQEYKYISSMEIYD